jgi:Tfp pilus assembly protein PilP
VSGEERRLVRRAALLLASLVIGAGAALAQDPLAEPDPAPMFSPPAAAEPAADEPSARGGGARMRDPFRPFNLDLRPSSEEEPLSPLQRYELAQLRVVAVLLDIAPPRALLEDNSGMGFIITPGTPVGRRKGVVTSIQPRRVLVEEKTMDFYGREHAKLVVLEMQDAEVQGGSQEQP